VVDPNAAAMAWICALVSVESDLIPLTLAIADWIWVSDLPDLLLEASTPWHEPHQLA
jgi:hypothetical protein